MDQSFCKWKEPLALFFDVTVEGLLSLLIYRALLTVYWGSIQGDIIFSKNSNARFRVITGANAKKFAPKSCQERPIQRKTAL